MAGTLLHGLPLSHKVKYKVSILAQEPVSVKAPLPLQTYFSKPLTQGDLGLPAAAPLEPWALIPLSPAANTRVSFRSWLHDFRAPSPGPFVGTATRPPTPSTAAATGSCSPYAIEKDELGRVAKSNRRLPGRGPHKPVCSLGWPPQNRRKLGLA